MISRTRSFYLSDGHYAWIKRWSEQSDLPMSTVVELLIEQACPSRLMPSGFGWQFIKVKTTYDILDDEDQKISGHGKNNGGRPK